MWDLHNIVARVVFQFIILMVVFSFIQLFRRQGINRLYFTGVLFTGGFAALTGVIGLLGTLFTGSIPSALHLAYGLVGIFTLPTIYHFEQQSNDDRRALVLYTVAFVVLAISIWRSIATGIIS